MLPRMYVSLSFFFGGLRKLGLVRGVGYKHPFRFRKR